MRQALTLEPGSKEAKKIGCICEEGKPLDDCPIHFPIRYIKKINAIEFYMKSVIDSQKNTSYCIIILLLVNIIATLN